jgi:penicillin-binding protein 1B
MVLGTAAALLVWFLCGYMLFLNHRISGELTEHAWRTPTEIFSTVRDGAPIARVYGTDWRSTTPVEIDDLPEHVKNAFVAAEDVRFRRHFGIDLIGITRALFRNVRAGGIAEGGSTINQQLIKQKLLTNERTWRRKFVEAIMAIILDVRLTKDEILDAYLNEVYLGHFAGRPVYGIDEGARLYFSKSPKRLTADEAALLASIIRAPNRDTPDKRPDLARARRDIILKRMHERRWISKQELEAGLARGVELRRGSLPEPDFAFALAALRREVIREVGEKALRSGGLRIECEIDPRMQREAERATREGAARLKSRYAWIRATSRKKPLQVAILSVDPRSGGIRAIVGGSDPRVGGFDRTVQMRRQPGSAFKPFAFLAAIARKEATAASLLLDAPLEVQLSSGRVWEPHNYDERYRGRVTLREAFEKSLNVPTVRLTQRVGSSRVVRAAHDFGFESELEPVPALPLGVFEVTVRELTAAYTPFANLGTRVEPFLLQRVKSRKGKLLFEHRPQSKKVVAAAPAFVLHSLLRGVVKRGTASRLRNYGLGFVAGKTGTTSDYRDAWFVGYTPEIVTTVWVGFDDASPLRLSSAEAAIPIWGSYMREVPLTRDEVEAPEGVVRRQIDPSTGFLWQAGCPGPVSEVFLSGTAPTRRCPTGFAGRVIRKVFFESESFDEPAAITFDKARQWAAEVDRGRQDVENRLERLKRFFRGRDEEEAPPRKRRGKGKRE